MSKGKVPRGPASTRAGSPSRQGAVDLQIAQSLHGRGRLAEAQEVYEAILRAQPKHYDALNLLAVLRAQTGDRAQGLQLLEQAIRARPDLFQAYVNRGIMQRSQGLLDAAMASFDEALARNPDCAEAFFNRGNVLRDLGRAEEAVADYDRALAVRPHYAEAVANRGNVLQALGRLEEALASQERAVFLAPGPQSFYNRANVLRDLGRRAEALAGYDKAIAQAPDFTEARNNRAALFVDLDRPGDALADYDRILALKPGNVSALLNRAAALRDLGRFADAIACYDQVIAASPGHAEAYRNRGLCRLMCGDFPRGFADHEYRWEADEFTSRRPGLAAPMWQGEAIEGKSILVFAEQGLGDTLQFCRYLAFLADRGARVTFLAPELLRAMLRPFADRVDILSSLRGDTAFDYQCALMSLPLRLGTELTSVPTGVPYLAADAVRVARWKERLSQGGRRIGIAWQGEPRGRVDIGRSVPLREFQPLAQVPGVRLISLQKKHGLEQLDTLPAGMTVETLGEDFDAGPDAFVDTAAVMHELDLVITSDTSIAHLAGALGRPVWVALKKVPDWRWLNERRDSPWYPTMRLFRQPTAGDWASVFRQMAGELVRQGGE